MQSVPTSVNMVKERKKGFFQTLQGENKIWRMKNSMNIKQPAYGSNEASTAQQ